MCRVRQEWLVADWCSKDRYGSERVGTAGKVVQGMAQRGLERSSWVRQVCLVAVSYGQCGVVRQLRHGRLVAFRTGLERQGQVWLKFRRCK